VARNELTPLVLSRHAVSALNTTAFSQNIDKGTGLYIDFFDTSQNNQQGRLILIVASDTIRTTGSSTAPINLQIRTSTNQAYTGSGIGKLELNVLRAYQANFGSTSTQGLSVGIVGPLETARFLDTDNRILVDWSTAGDATTATAKTIGVSAIIVP
jgi:hypothetical protein